MSNDLIGALNYKKYEGEITELYTNIGIVLNAILMVSERVDNTFYKFNEQLDDLDKQLYYIEEDLMGFKKYLSTGGEIPKKPERTNRPTRMDVLEELKELFKKRKKPY